MVPERPAPVAFGAAVHWTDPGPVPVAPAVIVIQDWVVVAVHWSADSAARRKESCVNTLTVPVSPAGFAVAPEGLMESVPPD
jgi:hypothetical protein